VATLEIKTADELIDQDLEARWTMRRAAPQAGVLEWILRTFLERGGRIPVDDIAAALAEGAVLAVRDAVIALDRDDLIRVHDGHVDLAYPFSALPTGFVVRLPGGDERYACCALDALGIAPMVDRRVEIRSSCHHCSMPLAFPADPSGPGPEADGVMLWLGRRAEERCRVADSL
jgi:hypothetical protein